MFGVLQQEPESDPDSQFYSQDQILNMDIQRLRRVLMKLGLPTAGTLAKMQARALAVSDAIKQGAAFEEAVGKAKQLR